MADMLMLALLLAGCYLLGSLNLSYIAGKVRGGHDLRREGSGNLGTHNVWNRVGKLEGTLVFFGDCAKAAVPVLGIRLAGGSLAWQVAAALAVMAGHNWPFWLGWRGGRGLVIALTALSILFPWGGLVLVTVITIGVAAGHTADMTMVGLCLVPVVAWRLAMPLSIILYTLGILLLTGLRRLQGSPGMGRPAKRARLGRVLYWRLLYDREVNS
ncbi:MAG: glycerol-3-phosphate acyltransferase [Candidatus Geothermincolia bacterium]